MSASIKNIEYLARAVRRLIAAKVMEERNGQRGPLAERPAMEAELKSAEAQYSRALARLAAP